MKRILDTDSSPNSLQTIKDHRKFFGIWDFYLNHPKGLGLGFSNITAVRELLAESKH